MVAGVEEDQRRQSGAAKRRCFTASILGGGRFDRGHACGRGGHPGPGRFGLFPGRPWFLGSLVFEELGNLADGGDVGGAASTDGAMAFDVQ